MTAASVYARYTHARSAQGSIFVEKSGWPPVRTWISRRILFVFKIEPLVNIAGTFTCSLFKLKIEEYFLKEFFTSINHRVCIIQNVRNMPILHLATNLFVDNHKGKLLSLWVEEIEFLVIAVVGVFLVNHSIIQFERFSQGVFVMLVDYFARY